MICLVVLDGQVDELVNGKEVGIEKNVQETCWLKYYAGVEQEIENKMNLVGGGWEIVDSVDELVNYFEMMVWSIH